MNWSRFVHIVESLIFPEFCLGCGVKDKILCMKCVAKLEFINGYEKGKGFYFDDLRWCLKYNAIFKKLIIHFKYKRCEKLSVFFGNYLKEIYGFKKNSIVIPVPISRKRLCERGFNQAKLLALCFCTFNSGLKFCDYLVRKFDRPKQSLLRRSLRLNNLEGSIEINGNVNGKNIILIDDVATTCSTLNECSRILKEAGAKNICCVVLARA
ncbi:hypothetical protein COU74_02240 [Candidatus Peregrinibacteria bacterium CG10_big_fil_rev_8_21_14_0_10_36_19]|nr:MAG: hypothetical protein COU74_02240 [Candidatus Peregrinibacteria bacterium CG10_big_fil_rev_8_21_14_0_10_36_19]